MKIAVINFSGNVGKTTISQHLLLPRLTGADLIAVESINADDGIGVTVRGKQFGSLQEQLLISEHPIIVDVGASNVEDFMKLMHMYQGSHEDFDLFIIPVVKDVKQIRDSIATIQALHTMGIASHKIHVVFNKVEVDDDLEDAFYPIFQFHNETKFFTLNSKSAIYYSELYQKLRAFKTSIPELVADSKDYKKLLRDSNQEEKEHAVSMISMKRLATSANDNLNMVFSQVVKL